MKNFLARKGSEFEIGDDVVEFKAENRADAIQKLAEGGYADYEIIWERPEGSVTKEIVSDGKGGYTLQIKEEK